MAFRGGDSVGFKGGRGGGRGRGGRGSAAFRGGRGRGGSRDATPVSRPSKVPSAFRVLSRADGASDADSAATAPVHGTPRPPRQPPHHRAQPPEEDDDAPPQAVSARRDTRADSDAAEHPNPRHQPPPQLRGRGRGAAAAGRARGAGRGSRGGNAPLPRHRNVPDEEDETPAQAKERGPTKVITTVTDHGTELPARLNNKVFLDGLPWNYDEPGKPTLEDEIMQFALAWKVGRPLRLIKKPGQGFGFLVFNSPHSVDTAVRVLNGRKFLGRALRVEVPKPRDLENMKDVAGMRDVGKDSFTRQVLLTDLNKVAQPEIIREVLRDVAPQLEKKLETIKMTSQNRKAFLTFENEADVDPAVTLLDGFHLLGRKIGAVRAAAPGSLSYSRSAHGGGKVPMDGATTPASGTTAEEEDEEATIVPLGVEPATVSVSAGKKAAPAKAPVAVAAVPAKGSNVTGKTAKYDLLDKGPREVYVGNLGDHVTAQQLREHLAPCGAITACELVVHPQTHLSSGIARVEFALPAYAEYAKNKYHGSRLRGCVLRVDRGDEASAPLASETPAPPEGEEYDEDKYMAEKYGVKDKKAYFKGTSYENDYRGQRSGEEDEEDQKKVAPAKKGNTQKRERATDRTTADKRAGSTKAKTARKEVVGRFTGADLDDDVDDDDGIDFVFGEDLPADRIGRATVKKGKTAAAVNADADDSDDEEHFFDVDSVPVQGGNPKGKGVAKKMKKKATTAVAGKVGKPGRHRKE